jgi:SMC interacting uncharacterized protein involved in chromosome segregation
LNGKVSKNGTSAAHAQPNKRTRRSPQHKLMQKKLAGLEGQLERVMGQKDGLDKVLADQDIYLDTNKVKLMETLSQYKTLGAEEDELLDEIEQLTAALE